MEFPAASAHRGLVPWLGLLLAVFLLAFWIPPTTAQFEMVSTVAVEGQDVILHTRNRPPDVEGFIWYKGLEMNFSNFIMSISLSLIQYITGPEYSGREIANTDGSLIIRNVTPRDRGFYTVVAVLRNSQSEIGFGLLFLFPPLSVPTLLASNTTVTENEDAVVMTCYTNGSFTHWLFNSQSLVLKDRMDLSRDRSTLTIDPVRREDAGNYQCRVSNPVISFDSAPVVLDVKY